jgi:hypothetical protein
MAKNVPAQENLTNSRYTDLVGEPVARLLSPIKGYEASPLVSLEQAITPITHLFDGIEENVWIAKENSKNPPDDLTQDESAAIHLYTMQFDTDPSFYQLLNSTLRGENRDNLKPWFAYLKLFLTALYKLPSHPQTIWRGIRGLDLSKQYPTGSKFAWWGVSSCTASLEVLQAETFLGRKGMRTLFSIESQNGKVIVPHSYFKDTENEIVLMPGTYFEVVGQVSPADDLYIIQLKELEPPFAFVKPPFKREPAAQKISKPSDDIVSSIPKPSDNIVPSTTNPSDSTNIFEQNALTSSNTRYMAGQQFQVPTLSSFGMGAGNFGMGAGNFGMGAGNFGMGAGNFGMGGGNFGMGANNFGMAGGNFGQGFAHSSPYGASSLTNPRARNSHSLLLKKIYIEFHVLEFSATPKVNANEATNSTSGTKLPSENSKLLLRKQLATILMRKTE